MSSVKYVQTSTIAGVMSVMRFPVMPLFRYCFHSIIETQEKMQWMVDIIVINETFLPNPVVVARLLPGQTKCCRFVNKSQHRGTHLASSAVKSDIHLAMNTITLVYVAIELSESTVQG